MEQQTFNFNKIFEVKPLNTEETEWTIVLGNRIATPIKYKTKREAIAAIHGRDWNLIASLIAALYNAMLNEEAQQLKEKITKNKED